MNSFHREGSNLAMQSGRFAAETVIEAAGRGDADVLRMAAHTLKSSSANVGAVALSSCCKELETRAKEGRVEGATAAVTAIEAEFRKVKSCLEELLGAGR